MKIVTIVGARPQFIKAAVVSRAVNRFNKENSNKITEVLVHTGQHYDNNMSEIFFEEMNIPKPDYFLGINGLSHGAMTGQMMEQIESVLTKESPEVVLVYGDTNSTLAGALAAAKLNIPLAHVEAGLRSRNMHMPEEINRILTDRISSFLFCPTDNAMENLKAEGFEKFSCKVFNSGDVMYDAAIYYSNSIQEYSEITDKLNIYNKEYILCTVHRAENTDDKNRLLAIFDGLREISAHYNIIFPIHPRTKKIIETNLDVDKYSGITFIPPVGYFDMIRLIKNSKLIMTDSGGLQKEAYFFKKYCITLRDETEWIELVENGYNLLSGALKNTIISNFKDFIDMPPISSDSQLYGNGESGMYILKEIHKNIV